MSKFTQFTGFEKSGEQYKLTAPLEWRIGHETSDWVLRVPEYRRFDLSVPRWLHWLLSPDDSQLLPAACVHDELLHRGFDRPFAASEFRRACLARGVSSPKAWVLFFATLFWTSFRKQI